MSFDFVGDSGEYNIKTWLEWLIKSNSSKTSSLDFWGWQKIRPRFAYYYACIHNHPSLNLNVEFYMSNCYSKGTW